MKAMYRAGFVAAALGLAFGVGGFGAACKRELPDSEVAARVNGQPITKAGFEAAVERNLARYRNSNHKLPPGIEARIQESVLRRLVNEEVIRQKAEEMGVTVPESEVQERFGEHKERFRTDEAFQQYLQRSGNTVEAMQEDLKRNMLRDALVEKMSGEVTVTPEEIEKYYNENRARFQEKEQVKASRILIRVAPKAPQQEKDAAAKKARDVLAMTKKPDADFAALAKEHSQGPEASRGGELSWLPPGRMTAEFDQAAFTLAPGSISNVVETRLGYEIIKVWEKKDARERSLDEVKESIESSLMARKRNDKRRDVLRELKSSSKVETLIEFEKPQPAARVPAPGGPVAEGVPPGPAPDNTNPHGEGAEH